MLIQTFFSKYAYSNNFPIDMLTQQLSYRYAHSNTISIDMLTQTTFVDMLT